MAISILEQRGVLIASLQETEDDTELRQLQEQLLQRVAERRARGVVLDVSALEIMDSYSIRTLRTVAHASQLCGARVVVVGMQPEVAFSMTQLGIDLDTIDTALDLDDALVILESGEPRQRRR